MDMMDKFTISASMLLTGFTIVFAVLIFLIFLIWLYGFIITKAQTKRLIRKKKNLMLRLNVKPRRLLNLLLIKSRQ